MTNPVTPVAPVSTPVVTEKKPETDLAKVVEENNKTAKTCAYAALGTSCATLIPLSVLAFKTGKISKVAKDIGEGVKPILDNAQAVSNKAKEELIKTIETLSSVLNEKELKRVLDSIKNKVDSTDLNKLVDSFASSTEKLTDKLGEKIDKVNVDEINNVITNFAKKLNEIDTSKLSEDTSEAINKFVSTLQTKLEGIDVSKLSAKAKETVQAIIERLKVMNPKSAESACENVERTVEDVAK